MSENTAEQPEEIQWEQALPATVEEAFVEVGILKDFAQRLGFDPDNVSSITAEASTVTVREIRRNPDGPGWLFREHTRLVRR